MISQQVFLGTKVIFNTKTGGKNLKINTKQNYESVNLVQALP